MELLKEYKKQIILLEEKVYNKDIKYTIANELDADERKVGVHKEDNEIHIRVPYACGEKRIINALSKVWTHTKITFVKKYSPMGMGTVYVINIK